MNSELEKLNDIELFELLKKEEKTAKQAFAVLYARHSSRVYAYCRRYLGNREEAQDAFQETFVKFYNSAFQERNMTNVSAFLLKIARNQCSNAKRKDKEVTIFEDYMLPETGGNKNEKEELLELIKMAMELLPDEYKDIFILREYDGLSYSEIAELTGMSMPAVKVRIFRAKKKVREILAPYLAEL